MKSESVSAMVDYANIMLTRLIIICNHIRYAFGKRDILPEEAVQNLGTGYMEAEYRTYEYEKDMEKGHINFWYIQAEFLITFELYRMMFKEAKKLINNVNRPYNCWRPWKGKIYIKHKNQCKIYTRNKNNHNLQACTCTVQELQW